VKRTIAGLALAAGLAVAAAAVVQTRPLWSAPDTAQAAAWLRDAVDRHDAGAQAALARWAARANAPARHAYASLLAHRADAGSRERLQQVLADGAAAGDADDATRLADLLNGAQALSARHVDDARIAALLEQGRAGQVAAAALLDEAAAGGDVPAMFLLANRLRAGEGVPRDDARALALYERAGDADYAPAIQALAIAWRHGELGLQADASQSRLMDHEAAEALAHANR